MSFSVLLDCLIAALLFLTVIYCWKLSRRITFLHEGKDDFNKFIGDFNNAILRAEDNVSQLKTLGEETDQTLNENIKKARFLANDLSFLMDKGEHVADVLERQIGASRAVTARPPVVKRSEPHSEQQPLYKQAEASENPTEVQKFSQQSSSQSTTNNHPNPPLGNEKPQPQTATEEVPPSKKEALDDVLAKIAVRKAQAQNPSLLQEGKSQMQQPQQAESSKAGADNKITSNPFDKRKLAQTLIASQGD